MVKYFFNEFQRPCVHFSIGCIHDFILFGFDEVLHPCLHILGYLERVSDSNLERVSDPYHTVPG